MKFGRFDRFTLMYKVYDSGIVSVEEPHTGLQFYGTTSAEARDQMIRALAEWPGDRPDPEEPVRTTETVLIDRRPPGLFEPPF